MKKLFAAFLFVCVAASAVAESTFSRMRFTRTDAPAVSLVNSITISDAGNMTITGSPCTSGNCEFTLASSGGGGSGAPTTAPFVMLTVDAGTSAEFSLGSLTTGLLLNTSDGTTGTLSQYAGIDCTNQFVRDVDAAGAGTCATVALGADVSGTLAAGQFPALTGDVTTSAGNLATTIAAAAVTYAKIQNVAANRLIGNATGSTAPPAEVPFNSTLEIATGSLGRAATTGDVVCPSASNACTIQANAVTTAKILDANVTTAKILDANVTTAKILDANVTYAKIQNVAGSRVLGNATGSPAVPAEVALNSTLEFASGALGRAATTGDVVCPSASNACTIQANAIVTADITDANVTYAKIQNGGALSVVGRSANSAGVVANISCVAGAYGVVRESGSTVICDPLPVLALDRTGVAANEVVQPVSDTVEYFDTSGATVAKTRAGMLRVGGRGGAHCYDEMFWQGETNLFNCFISRSYVGTGTITSHSTAFANHPGLRTCTTGGTDATAICGLQSGGAGTTATNATALAQVFLGGGRILSGATVKLDSSLSDGTNTYKVYVGGFGDQVLTTLGSAESVDGIYFRYTDTNGGADAEWEGVWRANSAETTCDTNVVANSGFHTYEIDISAGADAANFYIDGTLACAISTGGAFGTGRETAMMPIVIQKTVGALARIFTIDAYWYIFDFTTAR